MTDEHKIVGYTFELISVSGVRLATKQLDKPADVTWDDMDAHLAMWDMLKGCDLLKAELDGKLVTLLPDGIMELRISEYVYG